MNFAKSMAVNACAASSKLLRTISVCVIEKTSISVYAICILAVPTRDLFNCIIIIIIIIYHHHPSSLSSSLSASIIIIIINHDDAIHVIKGVFVVIFFSIGSSSCSNTILPGKNWKDDGSSRLSQPVASTSTPSQY
uniref:Uncharacterized protein n=1 Tax=Lotharella oceanica TaxID=641309 RepID=A0A7S2XFH4_9EUKA